MVQLTMTSALVAALQHLSHSSSSWPPSAAENEPSLTEPAIGKPITHGQVLSIAQALRNQAASALLPKGIPTDLDSLLRGSQVYVPPPPPKPEPSEEYKALMTRLRAEQESTNYTRMLASSSQSLNTPYNPLFPISPTPSTSILHDELSFRDINRQLTLIINVLISIVACSVAIWWATWHWSVGWRVGASMGGSGIVGVAEVVVYMGYIGRMGMAREKEVRMRERKSVERTWVIEGRKGVVERRVVGIGGDESGTGTGTKGAWVDAPGMRRRDKGTGR